MQEATDSEYVKMKAFLTFYVERYHLNLETLPPEKWPIASLEALEKRGMKTALKGLRQAINDCVERSSHFDHAEVESAFGGLERAGAEELAREGLRGDQVEFLRQIDLRYVGQSYELTIPIGPLPISRSRPLLIASASTNLANLFSNCDALH